MAEEKKPALREDPPVPETAPSGFGGWDAETVRLYFNTVLPQLRNRDHTSAPEWVDLLVEAAEAEKEFHSGFEAFFRFIKENGLPIEADQKAMLDAAGKMFGWRFLRQMINAMGLGRYEDDIMRYEIGKFYQRIEAPPLQPRRQPPQGGPTYGPRKARTPAAKPKAAAPTGDAGSIRKERVKPAERGVPSSGTPRGGVVKPPGAGTAK